MEKREPSHPVGGNVNWCSHWGKQYGGPSKDLKEELSCDPAVPFVDRCPKEVKSRF